VDVDVFVAVGGVPLTVWVRVGVGVMDGVINMGSSVHVGAFVRVGTSVPVGNAVRVGVGVRTAVSVKVSLIEAVISGKGIIVGGGIRKLRYGCIFRPGMEYPKYVKAKTPRHTTSSKVMITKTIFLNQFSPDDRFLGGCVIFSIGIVSFYFAREQGGREKRLAFGPA
jgi:hypothetical protein